MSVKCYTPQLFRGYGLTNEHVRMVEVDADNPWPERYVTFTDHEAEVARLESELAESKRRVELLDRRLANCGELLIEVQTQYGDTGSPLDERITSCLGVLSPRFKDPNWPSGQEAQERKA